MKIENQVCSLDLSKRLKELGFRQDSLFYWQKWTQIDWKLSYYKDFDGINSKGQVEINGLETIRDISNDTDDACSAYTVAELGEMLPIQECIIEEMVEDDEWYIKIEDGRLSDIKTYQEIANTEADARAKMLIYLKENNLI